MPINIANGEYQEFFQKKLEAYGVKSPSDLPDEQKKKFFDEVDSEWKAPAEEPEKNDEPKSHADKPHLVKLLTESKGHADNLGETEVSEAIQLVIDHLKK